MAMSPTTYTRTYTSFQNDLERRINADVNRAYGEIVPYRKPGAVSTARPQEDLLAEALGSIVTTYGPIAFAFGAFLFEEYTRRKATALLDDALPATTSSVYSLVRKSDDPLPLLRGSINRHVLNQARSAIHDSAADNEDLAYARVPNYVNQRDGKGPCEFCIVLASRGAVYADKVTAGGRGTGNEYHDDCWCVPTLMKKADPENGDFGDPSEWPRGYNPERLYTEIYKPSHEYLDTIKDVTRKIREKDPTFPLGL